MDDVAVGLGVSPVIPTLDLMSPATVVEPALIDSVRTRQQISHDIHHELGTIMLLATLLMDAPELLPDSRRRARLILGEIRWLEQLHRAYESAEARPGLSAERLPSVRIDEVATEVVDAMRLATLGTITISTIPVCARVSRLGLWRALRNVLDNAVRAAGADGMVGVDIAVEDGWVVIQVDDDGPGFGAAGGGRSSLGLHIVQEFVGAVGGQFEISRGLMGGCCVRLQIPEAPDIGIESDDM